jgi:signal transduction histidine kinase
VIDKEAREPVSIYLEYLDRSRFNAPAYQEELRRHLQTKYSDRPIGVIIGFGVSTLEFISPLRAAAWPDIPLVFGQVDEASYGRLTLPPNSTGHVIRLELSDMVAAARAVVPGLKNIAIVGDALVGQTAFRHFKDQLPEVAKEFSIIDLMGLPMSELQERVAALPEATAILYTAIYSDGRGTYFPPAEALKHFADRANRPIVIPVEANLGSGAVGGYLMAAPPIGTAAARLALRVLEGQDAGTIPVTKVDVVRPIFDWRQLKRWNVSESTLPPGSEIRYRPADFVETYASKAAVASAALLFIVVVTFSILEHRKRRFAEEASWQRMSELTLVNRQATVGEMSAAIAHELGQPLGCILNNAEAAELILKSNAPDVMELRELLADIRKSDYRASEIIRQLRALMSKTKSKFGEVDLNTVVREALEIAEIQAHANDITLHASLAPSELPVVGDPIQLQQVFLNLVINGIDAVNGSPRGRRDIVISTAPADDYFVEASVSDSGPGISKENLDRIFNPFFSTKESGMGVGLSLCRTIVEAHNGEIWVGNGMAGGAVFRLRLPLKDKGKAT